MAAEHVNAQASALAPHPGRVWLMGLASHRRAATGVRQKVSNPALTLQ